MSKSENEGILNMAKQMDRGLAPPPKRPTNLQGEVEILKKEVKQHRYMIHVLYTHMSKRDRLLFDKRFYK